MILLVRTDRLFNARASSLARFLCLQLLKVINNSSTTAELVKQLWKFVADSGKGGKGGKKGKK